MSNSYKSSIGDWRCTVWKAVSDVSWSPRIKCHLQKNENLRLTEQMKGRKLCKHHANKAAFCKLLSVRSERIKAESSLQGMTVPQSSILLDDFWKKSFSLIKHCCKQQSLTYCFCSLNTNLHMQIWSAMWCLSNLSFLYKMFRTKEAYKRPSRKESSTKRSITASPPLDFYLCCWEKKC